MAELTIAYDLHGVKDRSVYDSISNDILKTYKAVKLLNTTFQITGMFTSQSLSDGIKAIISKYVKIENYELVVFEISDYAHWIANDKIQKLNAWKQPVFNPFSRLSRL